MSFLRIILILGIAVTFGSIAHAEDRQVFHSNPLCDDYIRTKLDIFLQSSAGTNFDDYTAYKQELTGYCDQMLRCGGTKMNGSYQSQPQQQEYTPEEEQGKPKNGLRSYKLNLY